MGWVTNIVNFVECVYLRILSLSKRNLLREINIKNNNENNDSANLEKRQITIVNDSLSLSFLPSTSLYFKILSTKIEQIIQYSIVYVLLIPIHTKITYHCIVVCFLTYIIEYTTTLNTYY